MTYERPPSGLEFKAPAALMEPRPMPGGRPPQPPPDSGAARVDPYTGEFTALVAVTGVIDEVNDVLEPGCFRSSLRQRTPRVCRGHDWQRVIGRAVEVVEYMPGDPRLPRVTPKGEPWPPEAGALYVRARYVGTPDAQEARAVATAFGSDQGYSIGYKVTHAHQRGPVRHVNSLDLFEFSPVLHGANLLAGQLSIKDARPAGLEIKATGGALRRRRGAALGTVAGTRGRVVLTCAACGEPAGIARTATAPETMVCASCVDAAGMVDLFADPDLDDPLAPDPAPATAEDDYTDARRRERPFHLDVDGELMPGEHPARRRI